MSSTASTPTPSAHPPKWDPSTDPDGFTHEDMRGNLDGYLDFFVSGILGFDDENETNSIGMTVNTGGQIVSGKLITRSAWVAEVRGAIDPASPGLGDAFQQVHELYAERRAEMLKRRESDGLPNPPRRYIHFKDAHVVHGTTFINLGLWRTDITSVTGWTIGELNQS